MAIRFARLPLSFDAAALRDDAAKLAPGDWVSHFNTACHDGGWRGVALLARGGDPKCLYPDPQAAAAALPTPVLARCPAIRAALSALHVPLQSARLLGLAGGGRIREHRDYGLGLEEGTIRLHVPIVSGPDVEFYLDGMRVPMREGECWYLDFSLPHRVQNNGRHERVHLVIDCGVNDWVRALLPAELESEQQMRRISAAAGETSQQRFERFRSRVLHDPELQDLLRRCEDTSEFIELVTRTGSEYGDRFTAEDVRSALLAGRRAWIGRHLF